MKCLSGLLRPSEGTIRWEIDDRTVRNQDLRYFAGFAAPYLQFYNELTVTENLSFIRELRPAATGRHLSGIPASLAEILELTGLSDLAGRDFGTLSSGQQQRVRLAGALVPDPRILMLDEPGTNLDAEGVSLVAGLVARQQQRGGLTFLSSNREEELSLTETRIVLSVDKSQRNTPAASKHASTPASNQTSTT